MGNNKTQELRERFASIIDEACNWYQVNNRKQCGGIFADEALRTLKDAGLRWTYFEPVTGDDVHEEIELDGQ